MKRTLCFHRLLSLSFVMALVAAWLCPAALASDPTVELERIRIQNTAGGEISVSTDNGHSYTPVGHVLTPSTWLIPGFSATEWAENGTVCATAVHGIRICCGHNAANRGKLISIVPYEYRKLPDSFGGQRTGGAGIYTDIGAASSIFRNLAPLVGNTVFLEKGGTLSNLPADYWPALGDVLVIVVTRPGRMPQEIDIQNRASGLVEEVFADGERVTVAQVVKPVQGVGRYDATSYTGVGKINTNHPGVITVSTAEEAGVDISDEERGWERRGGFQIVPSVHAKEFHKGTSTLLIVGPAAGTTRPLEGTPPLFSGLIGLNDAPGAAGGSFEVQIRIDHGPWEPMLHVTGLNPFVFTGPLLKAYFEAHHVAREVKEGVTDFRILFPKIDRSYLTHQVAMAVESAAHSHINVASVEDRDAVVRGRVQINVSLDARTPLLKFVVFLVDGSARAYSDADSLPYQFTWDTRQDNNGRHMITVRGEDRAGNVLTQSSNGVYVANLSTG